MTPFMQGLFWGILIGWWVVAGTVILVLMFLHGACEDDNVRGDYDKNRVKAI